MSQHAVSARLANRCSARGRFHTAHPDKERWNWHVIHKATFLRDLRPNFTDKLFRAIHFSLGPLASTVTVSIWHVYSKCRSMYHVILMLWPSQKTGVGGNWNYDLQLYRSENWCPAPRDVRRRWRNRKLDLISTLQPWSSAPHAKALGYFPVVIVPPLGATCVSFLKKDFIYLFLERGEGREKERERNINVWLPLACPLLGTWPTTQACALTGNQTCDPLVHRPTLNLLSHTSQGATCVSIVRSWIVHPHAYFLNVFTFLSTFC